MADERLLAAIQAGNEEACNEFDRLFRPKIEAFVRKRRVPSQDCPDVAQEVLADAIRQIQRGKFRGDASLNTWLHPLINGWVVNYFRRRRGPKVVSLEDVAVDHESLVVTGNPDVVLAVNQALSRLSTDDQFLLVLHEQQKLTLEEIGPIVGLRKSAVADHLKAARERFRQALRDGGKSMDPKRLTE